jgi:hypothetical protein
MKGETKSDGLGEGGRVSKGERDGGTEVRRK